MDEQMISQLAKELLGFSLPSFADLPSIELYMDQVTGYLNPQLAKVCRSEDGEPLTKSMINNYVKGGHIARPQHKKYNPEHIAMLYMLCCVKQSLSISEASTLLKCEDIAGLYDEFSSLQREIVRDYASEILECDEDEKSLRMLATSLVLRSATERFIATKIIEKLAEKPKAKAKSDTKKK